MKRKLPKSDAALINEGEQTLFITHSERIYLQLKILQVNSSGPDIVG